MDVKGYIKRLETIQNMTDVSGVRELCEVLMDLLEEKENKAKPFGFSTGGGEDTDEKDNPVRRRR
jgi:hypothetical protein